MTKLKSKRLLSLFVSLAMVMSLIVTPVYAMDTSSGTEASGESSTSQITAPEPEAVAEDAETDDSGADALEAAASDQQENLNAGIAVAATEETDTLPNADDSGVITLTDDVALTGQYIVQNGETVTIDLSGYSITHGTNNTYDYLIVVESGATLIIKDSNAGSNTIEGGVYASGTLTIESGSIAPTSGNYGVYVYGGTVTVSGGTVSAYRAIGGTSGTLNVSGGIFSGTQIGIMDSSSLNVNISGGTITGSHSGVYVSGGTTTITGGTIGSSSTTYAVNVQGGTVAISNGAIIGKYGVYSIGTSEITGGTITATTCAVLAVSGGKVTIGTKGSEDGPTITGDYEAAEVSTSSSATASAEMTIYSGTITGTSYGIAVYGKNSTKDCESKLNVYGGTITAETYFAICGNGSTGQGYDLIYIYGGTITSNNAQAIYHPQQEGTMYVYGGDITGDTGIEVRGGTVVIDDSADATQALTIKATGNPTESSGNTSGSTTSGAAVAIATYNLSDISVTINSGTLLGASAVYESNPNETELTKSVTINMNGGTYDGAVTVEDADESTVTVTVTGGTYSTDVSDYLAESTTDGNNTTAYTVVATDSGNVVVSYTYSSEDVAVVLDASLAYVGSYSSLSSAYTAVKKYTDGTIYLVADITGEKIKVTTDVTFTLDLNGHTLDSKSNTAVLLQSSGASVTINDSGTNGTITTISTTAAVYSTAGSIVINGGTFTYTGDSVGYLVRCGGDDASIEINDGTFSGYYIFRIDSGVITVNGGTFTSDESGSIVYAVDSSASLIITDGWFSSANAFRKSDNDITVTGGYYTVSDTNNNRLKNYIPIGYVVTTETVDDTEWYTVGKGSFTVEYEENEETVIRSSHTTLSAAFSAAQDGDTVVMNDDSESGIKLNDSSKSLTLDLNGHEISDDDADSYVVGVVSGSLTIVDSSEDGTGTITGSISESSSSSITGIVRNMGGTLAIQSGTITIESGNAVNAYGGTTTISGGYMDGDVTTNSTLTITGGYFTADPSDYTGDYEVGENKDADYQYYVSDVIVGKSIALDGVTTILIYVDESGLTSATIGSTTYTDFSDLDTEKVGDINCYEFTQDVISYAMADDYDVILEVTNADDISYTVTTTASVRDYADALFASGDLTVLQENILTALLNYGAKAQIYFDYNTEDLANKNCTDTSDVISAVNVNDLSNYTNKIITNDNSSVSLKSYSLESKANFVLALKFSGSVEDLTVEVTGTDDTAYGYSTSGYYVLVELDATQLGDTLTVTLTNSDNTGTYSFTTSALSYARTVITNNSDTNKTSLYQALYLYYMSFSSESQEGGEAS
ncbi:MAG: hypothetical protein LIO80_00790 [Lachnospiraceae bacterium]|nr:hypothetical protein [Lachnospiraceae bacterium]